MIFAFSEVSISTFESLLAPASKKTALQASF